MASLGPGDYVDLYPELDYEEYFSSKAWLEMVAPDMPEPWERETEEGMDDWRQRKADRAAEEARMDAKRADLLDEGRERYYAHERGFFDMSRLPKESLGDPSWHNSPAHPSNDDFIEIKDTSVPASSDERATNQNAAEANPKEPTFFRSTLVSISSAISERIAQHVERRATKFQDEGFFPPNGEKRASLQPPPTDPLLAEEVKPFFSGNRSTADNIARFSPHEPGNEQPGYPGSDIWDKYMLDTAKERSICDDSAFEYLEQLDQQTANARLAELGINIEDDELER